MKRCIPVFLFLTFVVMIVGSCNQNNDTRTDALISSIASEAEKVQSFDSGNISLPESDTSESSSESSPETSVSDHAGTPVDIDLTVMNSTMIYSVIYDLMVEPDKYFGKCIMVDGYFDTMFVDQFDSRYYFVVVPDATACCVQGLEFRFENGDRIYPDDYPEVRDNIRVKGVLGNYEDNGQTYAYIKAEEVIVNV